MIQQFQFWVYAPKNQKKESADPHSQQPKGGSHPSVHPQMMDKHGLLFRLTRETNSDTLYNMDEL